MLHQYVLRHILIVIITSILLVPVSTIAKGADHCQSSSVDLQLGSFGRFEDISANNNCSLLLLVGGLGRADTWDEMIGELKQNSDFNKFDYLVIHANKSRDIEQNVEFITATLNQLSGYQHKMMVGYSMGGVLVKRFILKHAHDPLYRVLMPELVVTYATPLATSKLKLQFSKRFRWNFGFHSGLTPLELDILDGTQLLDISTEWRAKEWKDSGVDFRYVAVFPTNDSVASSDMEESSADTVFIEASHLNVLKNHCAREVLRELLINPGLEPRTLPCAMKSSDLNAID
jgi:pimeloyl-ACP methyl ester carboxylesterase